MPTNRKTGARVENQFASKLRQFFPEIRSARATQAYDGGNDFVNTTPFNFECKGGKTYKIPKWIRDAVKQCEAGGKEDNINTVLVQEKYKEPLVIMPLKDFIKFMEIYF